MVVDVGKAEPAVLQELAGAYFWCLLFVLAIRNPERGGVECDKASHAARRGVFRTTICLSAA